MTEPSATPHVSSRPGVLPGPVDPYLTYRRTLLSPERVRELSQLRPWRAVVDTARSWAVIGLAWWTVASFPHFWVVLLAIPIIGSSYYALFIIGHDGLHRRVFPRTRDNDAFTDLCVFGPVGAITRINNRNHIDHHLYLATGRDPDRHKHGCFNKARPLELLGYLTGVSSVLRSAGNVFRGRGGPRESKGYTLRDIAILGGWQVALIGGLSAWIGLWAWPVLWLLPVFVFTVLADNLRSFLEHSHPEADALADEHRMITFTSNPLERHFLSPMHMNFHTAHHLWPSIPYYNLPLAEREMRELAAARTLELRGSYLAYLFRYYRALPLDDCKPGGAATLPAEAR